MKRFKIFLSEAKNMIKLTKREWQKYEWRTDVFLRKYKAGEKFILYTNEKLIFKYEKQIYDRLKDGNINDILAVRLTGLKDDKTDYKLTDLGKTKEFGGRGEGSGTAKEDIELASLRDQIEQVKTLIGKSTIPMNIGNKIYDVFDVVTTPGTPKSDFHLVDIDGNELVWISHKDGSKPKDFQQWGGVSARKEPSIASHIEVKGFISDLKLAYPDGLPRATTLYRKIKDKKLKMISVYGNEYKSKGKNLSRQNCSLLIQGPVKIKKQGKSYVFQSNHVHYNGEDMTGGFTPVLTAIYKGDRNDAGVKGTRIVIMPIEGRKMTGTI